MRDYVPTTGATWRRVPAIALGGALALVIGAYGVSVAAETSPSPASEDEKPVLVAINRGATQQYFIDLQSAFTQEVERLGGTALTYDAHGRPEPHLDAHERRRVRWRLRVSPVSAQSSDLGPALAEIADAAGVALGGHRLDAGR